MRVPIGFKKECMSRTGKSIATISAPASKCRRSGKLFSATLACLALASCKNEVAWHEQVSLSKGEVITIEREVLLEGGGAAWPQGQGSRPRQHIIRFQPTPGIDASTEWQSSKLDASTYAELPVVLDVSGNKSWFILTALPLNASCVQYLKYELRDGKWQEVRLDGPIGTYVSNLTLRAGSVEIKRLVTIGSKIIDLSDYGFVALQKQVGPRHVECDDLYSGPYPPKGTL